MLFESRQVVARELARRLVDYLGQAPLVLAIPRGAVPMARIVAEALEGELGVVLVHKLGAPYAPEYAIGAIDEQGRIELREQGFDPAYVQREAQRQLTALRARRARYGEVCPRHDAAGRTVIVVDDGVATGATLTAALRSIRAEGPARLIAAIGVAPPATAAELAGEVDELVVLDTPPQFYAVGQFYAEFPQVSDREVIEHLRAHGRRGEAAR